MKKNISVLFILLLTSQVFSKDNQTFPDPPSEILSLNFPFPRYSGAPDFVCEKGNLRYEVVLNRAFGQNIYIFVNGIEQKREHLYYPLYGKLNGYEYYQIGYTEHNGIELVLKFPEGHDLGVGKDNSKSLPIGRCKKLF
jgi:hypothetical protein